MAGFSADWLRQREPFDLAARSQALAIGFQTALTKQPSSSVRIMDLACGSGANFRALAPLLNTDQEWLMVDHDPGLLTAQRAEIAQWASRQGWRCQDHATGGLLVDAGTARWRVRQQQLDLAHHLEDLDLASCDGLVTTAFLDLVSAAWLDRLSVLMTRTPRPLLATLTVDGRRTWQPARPADRLVTDAFLSHQNGDKGFGPSLGVQAASYLAARLAQEGYQVSTQASDWHIGHEDPEMLLALSHEAAAVASQTGPAHAAAASTWLAERSNDLQQALLSLAVGHLDLLALPPSA
ncbi:MAG: class I SAM-dependent methyltransferase [Rubrivivax sp.]|nr:MAG: class I SAM-dependent methyltransferase [Rubrivivax sp.]